MRVCVLGLWHLGTVTAACLASFGHDVTGLDFEVDTIESLRAGKPPLFEPGLEELVQEGQAKGCLHFTSDISSAVQEAEVVWVTYDTPVDEEDRADVGFVEERVQRLFPHLEPGALVLISSQLPVGTTRRLAQTYQRACPEKPVSFAYSPENLRLGKAIEVFTNPDRVVVGVEKEEDQRQISELLQPLKDRIVGMSIASAEMTKHAVNAFLAVSVTFINEIATLCEQVGADAKEVERGLKTEARIGPKAYLSPGGPFAGGTLARDILFLSQMGRTYNQPTYLLSAVKASNDAHKNWMRNKLQAILGNLNGQRVAIWGLTYKPGTDTLRRSTAVELCEWLAAQGAQVQAHDPAVKVLPPVLAEKFKLFPDPIRVLQDAMALVVATEWPEYKAIAGEKVRDALGSPHVIDANRFLANTLGLTPGIKYYTVGKG
jgi:UDPglucose 6-dehydrogenase